LVSLKITVCWKPLLYHSIGQSAGNLTYILCYNPQRLYVII
jgi:hypothetical protein